MQLKARLADEPVHPLRALCKRRTPCADAFVGLGIARRQTFRWEPARSLRVLAITLQVRRQRLP